jgi:hypothetical protein
VQKLQKLKLRGRFRHRAQAQCSQIHKNLDMGVTVDEDILGNFRLAQIWHKSQKGWALPQELAAGEGGNLFLCGARRWLLNPDVMTESADSSLLDSLNQPRNARSIQESRSFLCGHFFW